MANAYVGKVLWVDLGSGRLHEEEIAHSVYWDRSVPIEKMVRHYWDVLGWDPGTGAPRTGATSNREM